MHSLPSRNLLLCFLAGLALISAGGATGCGGAGASDEQQISDSITRAFTDTDPKLCSELLTADFIKTFYGTVAKCEQNAARGGSADSVTVIQTTVKGEIATALIQPKGGSASAKPVTLRLVKDGGTWKIDGVTG